MAISDKCMYVAMSQRVWQAASADRLIASRVEVDNHAERKTMKVVKQLAPREKLLPIHRVVHVGIDHHKKLTLPGLVDGQRLLATRIFDEYAATQSEIKEHFYSEVKTFTDKVYPDIVEMAPRRLGSAFRPEDFPKVASIASYFSYSHEFSPVPDASNWYLDDLSGSAMEELRNSVENQKNSLFRDAAKNLMERTREVLENLVNQIDTFDENQTSGKLREVTINSVKEMVDLMPGLNITEDPVIDAIAKDMNNHFAHLEASELRKDAAVRSRVSDLTKKILARMA